MFNIARPSGIGRNVTSYKVRYRNADPFLGSGTTLIAAETGERLPTPHRNIDQARLQLHAQADSAGGSNR
jgi:hypothetical protein